MKNKTILITGSTSGFGKGLVRPLLEQGHRVIATGRRLTERTDIFANERKDYPHQFIEKDLDVTSSQDREKLLLFMKELGSLDVLINNAGYGLFGPLEGAHESQLRHQIEVNLMGPMILIRDLLPFLRGSKGLVINLSSVLGYVGFPLASAYCSTKFGIEGLTESLAYELAPHGVRFALVEPGAFGTNFNQGTQWTQESENAQSPYFNQVVNYRLWRKSIAESKSLPDPQEVVTKILYLIENEKAPFRTTIGKDAKGTRWMQALLPKQIFFRLTSLFFLKGLSKPLHR